MTGPNNNTSINTDPEDLESADDAHNDEGGGCWNCLRATPMPVKWFGCFGLTIGLGALYLYLLSHFHIAKDSPDDGSSFTPSGPGF